MSNSNDDIYRQNIADTVYRAFTASAKLTDNLNTLKLNISPIKPALAGEGAYAAYQIDSEDNSVPTVVVTLT